MVSRSVSFSVTSFYNESQFLTLLHLKRPKLYRVLAILSAIGLQERGCSCVAILSWSRGYKKKISCSTELSMKFFPCLNVKMPTTVGILTCIRGKNTILGLTEPGKTLIS